MTIAADFDLAVPDARVQAPAGAGRLLLLVATLGVLALAVLAPAVRPQLFGLLIAGAVWSAALKLVLRWSPPPAG